MREILVLHHTHTDIGYTHDQPIVWKLNRQFIDDTLDEIDRTQNWDAILRPIWTSRSPRHCGTGCGLSSWRMVRGLEKRTPGLSRHIVYYSLGTPLTNEHYLNATRGNLYGIEKSPS